MLDLTNKISLLQNNRAKKELDRFLRSGHTDVRLKAINSANEILFEFDAAAGSLYEGETYQLKFVIVERYPFDPPIITFHGASPVHEHCYSNGHICLSVLYRGDWTPALNIESSIRSIQSMLASATEKERPVGDANYSRMYAGSNPQNTSWDFHDKNC